MIRRRTLGAHEAGFTLIEVVMTLFIFAIMTETIFQTFIAQEKSFKMQEKITDAQQNMRVTASAIAADIRNAGAGIYGAQCLAAGNPPQGGVAVPDRLVGNAAGAAYQHTRGIFALNNQPVPPAIVTPPDILAVINPANPSISDTLMTISAPLSINPFDPRPVSVPLSNPRPVRGPVGGAYDFRYCNRDASHLNLINVGEIIVVTNMRDSGIFRVMQKSVIPAGAECQGSQAVQLSCATGDSFNTAAAHRQGLSDTTSNMKFVNNTTRITPAAVSLYRMIIPATDTALWNPAHPRPILMRESFRPDTSNPLTFAPADPVADNIATLQLGFGLDRAVGNAPHSHRVGPDGTGNLEQVTYDFQGASPVDNPARIRSARVHLLTKTSSPSVNEYLPAKNREQQAIGVVPGAALIGDYTLNNAVDTGFTYRLSQFIVDSKNSYGVDDDVERHLQKQGCK